MSQVPTYLVKAPDGKLYGYWSEVILFSDLWENRSEGGVEVFELERGLKTSYRPLSAETLQAKRDALRQQALKEVQS